MDEIKRQETWPGPDAIQKYAQRLAEHEMYDIPYKHRIGSDTLSSD